MISFICILSIIAYLMISMETMMLGSRFKILFLMVTLLFVLFVPFDNARAQTPNIIGTWTGSVTQNTDSSNYTVILTVTSEGPDIQNVETNYPELNCGGKLARIGASKGYIFYTETITRGGQDSGGSCIDGTITIALVGKKLAWGWFGNYSDEVYAAWSTLVRK